MSDLEIIDTNAGTIHNYGFCGYRKIEQEGYRRKLDWLKQRFSEGMKFKVLYSENDGAAGFIEAGDSGSLLVTDYPDSPADDRKPVGLLFAGTDDGSTAVANPIQAVLAAFGVTIDGD